MIDKDIRVLEPIQLQPFQKVHIHQFILLMSEFSASWSFSYALRVLGFDHANNILCA
jgi:hypothetical protein